MTLEHRAPFEGDYSIIATADIETAHNGKLLDINLAFNLGEALQYYTCESWEEFFDLICTLRTRDKIKLKKVWFHNGGRFDYVDPMMRLYRADKTDPLLSQVKDHNAVISGGCILEAAIKLYRGKTNVKLGDSFRLTTRALQELAEGFGLDGKDHVPERYKSHMEEYKRDFPAEYHAYHKRDTVLLLDVLHRFRDTLNTISPIGDLPMTAASTAMRVFQTSFIKEGEGIVTPSRDERRFTRLAFQGGRTEYVGDGNLMPGERATYSGVHIYDVNSQYPSVMRNSLFPTTRGTYTQTEAFMRYESGSLKGSILPGCYRCSYEQRHGRIAILKPISKDGVVSKEAAWSGETYATHIELNEIERRGGYVKIHEGFFHEPNTMKPIFRDFIDTMYAWRLKADAEGNAALKYTVKILMNSLYGKFAIAELGERFALLTPKQVEELMSRDDPPILKNLPHMAENAYSISEPIKAAYAFPAIAAFITAQARLTLISAANDHNIGIIYCDTDSVHTQQHLPDVMVHKTELGKFKCETAEYKDGLKMIYGDRKMYAYLTPDKNGKKKAVCKGIPNKCINVESFAASIARNAPNTTEYTSPSGIKTAIIRGDGSPNEFKKYSRTTRPGVSSKAKGLLRKV